MLSRTENSDSIAPFDAGLLGLLAFRRSNALASRHLSRIYALRGGGIRVFCGVVVLVPNRRGYPVRVKQ